MFFKSNTFFILFLLTVVNVFGASPGAHQTTFIDRPNYQTVAHPPEYLGASVVESIGNVAFYVNDPLVEPSDITWADDDGDGFGDVPSDVSQELSEHYLLNQLVEDLDGDPIALAAFVQNEIEIVNAFQKEIGWVFQWPENRTIVRGASGVYLEKQGSPWEQCALLVYLLRRAGYPAAIVEAPKYNDPYVAGQYIWTMRMHVDRLDRMYGFRVNETAAPDENIWVDYPWVVVNDQKDGGGTWRHLFPWIKDIIVEEGFDPYSFLPEDYNSGEKWVEKYLQGDPAIMGLVGPDGRDAAGLLFSRFLSQYIADDSLSLEDVGFNSYYRKSQYNEWADFPRPNVVALILSNWEIYSFAPVVKDEGLYSLDNGRDHFIVDDADRFMSVQVTIYDEVTKANIIQTDAMLTCQLTNRNLYLYRDGLGGDIGLVLDAFNPNGLIPVGDFTGSDFAGRQSKIEIAADTGQELAIRIDYFNVTDIGIQEDEVEVRTIPLEKGVSSIVFNNGKVTPLMVDEIMRGLEETLAQPTPSRREVAAQTAFLAGQSYWMNALQDDTVLAQLHKIYKHSIYGVCISKFVAIGEAGSPYNTPSVDIPGHSQTYLNGSIHPADLNISQGDSLKDFWLMRVANLSAHEHQVINSVYGTKNAISTVKLLQIANRDFATGIGLNPDGYYEFNRAEFDSANTDPLYATLKSSAGSLWDSARARMSYDDLSYETTGWERVYMTPFDITMDSSPGEISAYVGMGVFVTSLDGISAFIGSGQNGGAGPTSDQDLTDDLILDDRQLVLTPDGSLTITDEKHPTEETTPDPQTALERSRADEKNGTDTGESPTGPQNKGDVGTPENNDGEDDVGDPVDPITGKFVSDHVDLTLNGPFPLQLSRNYSSLNVAHNLFGYSWKLNFMPYINVKADDSALFVADLDGSVVQYNFVPASSPMRWEASTDTADNPYLDNNNGGAIGGQSNRYAAYVEKTTEGSDTVYTLHKPNGHEARYLVRSFATDLGAGTVQRTRPYLDTWEDAFGNTMTFSYYEDKTSREYGELRRIQSSNGNYIVFLYNRNREITEAFTNDGRRLYYSYDEWGDLCQVTLPDNAVIKYDYKYLTDLNGDAYSTHLIERITKPDGRVLENTYDLLYDPEVPANSAVTLRRVISQKATVGDSLTLVENAVYEYFEANDASVTDPTAQPWTQTGYDVTLIHSDVRSQLGRLTSIYVHKDGLKQFIADPLASDTFAPRNTDLDYVLTYEYYGDAEANGFPRSLKRMRNKRGLETLYEYDLLGNPSKVTKRGDVTGDGASEDVDTYFFYDAVKLSAPKRLYIPPKHQVAPIELL